MFGLNRDAMRIAIVNVNVAVRQVQGSGAISITHLALISHPSNQIFPLQL